MMKDGNWIWLQEKDEKKFSRYKSPVSISIQRYKSTTIRPVFIRHRHGHHRHNHHIHRREYQIHDHK